MKKILNSLGLKLLPVLLNILISTLKIRISGSFNENKNYVFIFWHSQMILGWWLFKNRKSAALVSKSKDGDILSRLLKNWNYKVIRGSSSQGGKKAIEDISELVKDGYSAVITPDGPRGPAGEIKNGALIISNHCGVPLIPVRIFYNKKKILTKSWDRFEIPLPFSVCEIFIGGEFNYSKYLQEEELSEFKKNIIKEM